MTAIVPAPWSTRRFPLAEDEAPPQYISCRSTIAEAVEFDSAAQQSPAKPAAVLVSEDALPQLNRQGNATGRKPTLLEAVDPCGGAHVAGGRTLLLTHGTLLRRAVLHSPHAGSAQA